MSHLFPGPIVKIRFLRLCHQNCCVLYALFTNKKKQYSIYREAAFMPIYSVDSMFFYYSVINFTSILMRTLYILRPYASHDL